MHLADHNSRVVDFDIDFFVSFLTRGSGSRNSQKWPRAVFKCARTRFSFFFIFLFVLKTECEKMKSEMPIDCYDCLGLVSSFALSHT